MCLFALVLCGCTNNDNKKSHKYQIKILDINSLHVIIPDIPLQSLDVYLLTNIISNIKQKVFINRSGRNIQMKLKVIEFKKPIEDCMPYFLKFEFSGFGTNKDYVITGTYDISELNIENQNDIKTILYDIADSISDKLIAYLNYSYGFQHSDTFADAFITYNQENYTSKGSQVGPVNNGLYVTWEYDNK